MVVPAGIPDSAVVLVVLTLQVLVSLLRSEPPVLTKLMLPVSRTKRVIACAWAEPAPNSASIPIVATNAKTRHPRFFRPRTPRPDGTLMGIILAAALQCGRAQLS